MGWVDLRDLPRRHHSAARGDHRRGQPLVGSHGGEDAPPGLHEDHLALARPPAQERGAHPRRAGATRCSRITTVTSPPACAGSRSTTSRWRRYSLKGSIDGQKDRRAGDVQAGRLRGGQPEARGSRGRQAIATLGMDSVAVMELVSYFEEKLSVRIPDEELSRIRTVKDLARRDRAAAAGPGIRRVEAGRARAVEEEARRRRRARARWSRRCRRRPPATKQTPPGLHRRARRRPAREGCSRPAMRRQRLDGRAARGLRHSASVDRGKDAAEDQRSRERRRAPTPSPRARPRRPRARVARCR